MRSHGDKICHPRNRHIPNHLTPNQKTPVTIDTPSTVEPNATALHETLARRIRPDKRREIHGPENARRMYRSQTATYKHGLYAVRSYKLPGESNEEFAELQAQLHAYWQPKGYYDAQLVEELVGNLWEAKRSTPPKTTTSTTNWPPSPETRPNCPDQAKLNLEAEKKVSVPGGNMDRLNARLAHLARERHRIERELLRLEKRACTSGPTQMSLKINNRQHPDIPASEDAKPVDGRLRECPLRRRSGQEPLPETFAPGTRTAKRFRTRRQEAAPNPATPKVSNRDRHGVGPQPGNDEGFRTATVREWPQPGNAEGFRTAETVREQPQPGIVTWAKTELNFEPDAFQTEIFKIQLSNWYT